jgi:hypothetical protein
MSQIIDPSVGTSIKQQFSLEHARKAYGAGIGGAIAGAGTISLSGIFADGKITGSEVLAAGGAIVGGFVVGFFGAWLPSQTPAPRKPGTGDVLVGGDGLGDDGQPKHAANS